jgi:hypothetical protein
MPLAVLEQSTVSSLVVQAADCSVAHFFQGRTLISLTCCPEDEHAHLHRDEARVDEPHYSAKKPQKPSACRPVAVIQNYLSHRIGGIFPLNLPGPMLCSISQRVFSSDEKLVTSSSCSPSAESCLLRGAAATSRLYPREHVEFS